MQSRLQEIAGWPNHRFEAYVKNVGGKRKRKRRLIKLQEVRRLADGQTVAKRMLIAAGKWSDGIPIKAGMWITFKGTAKERKEGSGEYTIIKPIHVHVLPGKHSPKRRKLLREIQAKQLKKEGAKIRGRKREKARINEGTT